MALNRRISTNIQALQRAMKRDEFQLYYQPKVDLASGIITGVEALIRWNHPEQGMVYPNEFIPAVEACEFIVDLGEWVLRTACAQNKVWQDEGRSQLVMAVNVSGRQLHQPHFAERVKQIVQETGLDPHYLELEITENTIMDVRKVLPVLWELQHFGARISLDDFGIGYSCLYWLKQYPIDIIKIDRSFVNQCMVDPKDATIIKAIIAMAHELNVQVVAEGIESKEQLTFLQQNLCDRGQGYLFSPPLPPIDVVGNFGAIEQVVGKHVTADVLDQQPWMNETIQKAQRESMEILRYQHGMTFKFVQRNGQFIHTFCAGELLYRLGLTPQQAVGKSPHHLLPYDDAERKLQYYQRAWEGEEDVSYEMTLNGLWYLASLRPIRRRGQVVEVIGSCIDITERKTAARTIAEEKEKLESLLNNAQDCVQIMDLHGNILRVNPSWEVMYGWTEHEVMGMRNPIISDDQLKDFSGLVERLLYRERIPRYEQMVYRKDGTRLYVSASIYPIHDVDGNVTAIVCSTRDVTEQKEAERKLRESEEKYRLIAENMQDLIGILDTTGIVKYASPSLETVLGFEPAEFEGNSVFNWVHPDDLPYVQQRFAQVIIMKEPCRLELRYRHAYGHWVHVEAHCSAVLDDCGEVIHAVVVARDITKRKESEELVHKTEKLSIVGELAAGVAHEIRNPLTAIKGFTQLLQTHVYPPTYIDTMLSEIQRLESIIEEFLALAKPQSPKMKETDVTRLIQQVVLLFRTQGILRNVEIVERYATNLARVYCDGNQIKQVVINVLQNAVEAMPSDGVVYVESLQTDAQSIKMRVKDQGCGMSEERLKHLGEPFYSSKEKGTGLGLTVSYKIIQQHGGSIRIDSTVNHGTTVEISLPVSNAISAIK